MKKHNKFIIFLLLIAIVSFSLTSTPALAARMPEAENTAQSTGEPAINRDNIEGEQRSFKLPSSLMVIDEGTFEGTSLSIVDIPDHVLYIGNDAFANIGALKTIRIPDSTAYIGDNAFRGSSNVTIISSRGSYARDWAKKNSIPSEPVPMSRHSALLNSTGPAAGFVNSKTEMPRPVTEGETREGSRPKSTGRMNYELNADRYESITALHIEGRSPPIM